MLLFSSSKAHQILFGQIAEEFCFFSLKVVYVSDVSACIPQSRKTNPPPLFTSSSFLHFRHFCHFYTSAGQTCIAVVSKSKIDEEKLSSGTNDDYPDLSYHVGVGTLHYCHHHKPLLYSKNFAKLFSTQRHASSCGDVLGLCA